jgi:glycosyltransferase involved in cell wall biosynthesis
MTGLPDPKLSGNRGSVWIVTDQLPHPPRNGITLPLANYLEGLRRERQVRLVLLVDADHPPAVEEVADNEALYGPIFQIGFRRRSQLMRVIGELCGREMAYHGWIPVSDNPPLSPPAGCAVLVSPMSAVAKWRHILPPWNKKDFLSIAAVHDCTAAQYHHRDRQLPGKQRLRIVMDRWRAPGIARIEKKLLRDYDHILLQTEADLELMRQWAGEETASRVTLAPNGVRAKLFSLEPDRNSLHITLVGELSGEYGPIARWLVREVWPLVQRAEPNAHLTIVGRGADERLVEAMNKTPGVSYIPFVNDLAEIFGASQIVLSPVFKGYGLINKTLEAMAAGVPVVGGASAFNGIDGFMPGKEGLLCETREASVFAAAIIALLRDRTLCREIGESGRARVRGNFEWSPTLNKINTLLEKKETICL